MPNKLSHHTAQDDMPSSDMQTQTNALEDVLSGIDQQISAIIHIGDKKNMILFLWSRSWQEWYRLWSKHFPDQKKDYVSNLWISARYPAYTDLLNKEIKSVLPRNHPDLNIIIDHNDESRDDWPFSMSSYIRDLEKYLSGDSDPNNPSIPQYTSIPKYQHICDDIDSCYAQTGTRKDRIWSISDALPPRQWCQNIQEIEDFFYTKVRIGDANFNSHFYPYINNQTISHDKLARLWIYDDSNTHVIDWWFNQIYSLNHTFGSVKIWDKYHIYNFKTWVISEQWFNAINSFNEIFGSVKIWDKYHIYNFKTWVVSQEWFDGLSKLDSRFCKVLIEGILYIFDLESWVKSNEWYETIYKKGEFYIVEIWKKSYLFNPKTWLRDKKWFNYIKSVNNKFCAVKDYIKYHLFNHKTWECGEESFHEIAFLNDELYAAREWTNYYFYDFQTWKKYGEWFDYIQKITNKFCFVRKWDMYYIYNLENNEKIQIWSNYTSQINDEYCAMKIWEKYYIYNFHTWEKNKEWFDYITLASTDFGLVMVTKYYKIYIWYYYMKKDIVPIFWI